MGRSLQIMNVLYAHEPDDKRFAEFGEAVGDWLVFWLAFWLQVKGNECIVHSCVAVEMLSQEHDGIGFIELLLERVFWV